MMLNNYMGKCCYWRDVKWSQFWRGEARALGFRVLQISSTALVSVSFLSFSYWINLRYYLSRYWKWGVPILIVLLSAKLYACHQLKHYIISRQRFSGQFLNVFSLKPILIIYSILNLPVKIPKKKRIAHKCNKSNLFEQITTCVVLKLQFFVLSTSQVDELITNSHKYTSNYRMVTLEKNCRKSYENHYNEIRIWYWKHNFEDFGGRSIVDIAHKGIVNAPCINIDSEFQKWGGKRLKKTFSKIQFELSQSKQSGYNSCGHDGWHPIPPSATNSCAIALAHKIIARR